MKKIKLGYRMLREKEKQEEEEGTLQGVQPGQTVEMEYAHSVVTGLTQKSGKTTTLEKMADEAEEDGYKVLAFLTKEDEGGFAEQGNRIRPYYKDKVDWEYVVQILETAMNKSMDFKEPWIINAVEADKYSFLQPAESLEEVHGNIKTLLEKHRDDEDDLKLKSMTESVYTSLDAYFRKVVPKIQEADLATELELQPGLNVMDLTGLDREVQALIIGRTTEKIYKDMSHVVEIIPEAWKFMPQGKGSPCKEPAENFIRQAAGKDDWLWLDSQDVTSVSKTILKQVDSWILGYQKEKNEVDRTRDQMPMTKRNTPGKEEVMSLGIGEFFYCADGIQKVYVDPVWIDEIEIQGKTGEELAKAIAKEKIDSEKVKQARKQQLREKEEQQEQVDEERNEKRQEEEVDDRDELEKRVESLTDRVESLKQEVDSYESQLQEKDQKIDELQNQVEAKDSEIERLRGEIEQDNVKDKFEDDNEANESSSVAQVVKQATGQEHQNSTSQPGATAEKTGTGVDEERIQNLETLVEKLHDKINNIETQAPDVDLDLPEKKIEQMVDRKIDEKGGVESPVENVQDELLQEFLEDAINKLMNSIEEMSSRKKKLLLYLEAKGSRENSMKSWGQNALGWNNINTRVRDDIKELINGGWVEEDSNKYYPNLKSKVEDQLEGYKPEEQDIEDTYQKLLAQVKEEVDS